jgi:hypothetical protein
MFQEDKEDYINDKVKALDFVNYQISELVDIKQKLEEEIIEGLSHAHEGSKSYVVGKYKVTIKTDFIYSLDKEEYSVLKGHVPAEFNPVKESVSYTIDKRIIKKAEDYASKDELMLLSKLISKKPAKPNVKVLPNV